MKSLRLIIPFFCFFYILSCGPITYNIVVGNDGKAKADIEKNRLFENYSIYESNLILEFDSTYYRTKFTIKDVDSLGNYFTFNPPGFFLFKKTDSLFELKFGNGKPFYFEHYSCCNMDIKIEFENKIQSVESTSSNIYAHHDDSTLHVYIHRKYLYKDTAIIKAFFDKR